MKRTTKSVSVFCRGRKLAQPAGEPSQMINAEIT